MINIIWPNEKNIKLEEVGGKAWNLVKLARAGFDIPYFFVITTNVFNFSSFSLEEEILENFNKLKSPHVAVRSSATCEDKTDSSFAGQFESYLGISKGKLMENVKKCWLSAKNERAKNYAQNHNFSLSSIKMAVIIQKMIFAEKGGVVFTQNVFENDLNHLIIEAASGLGEKIVSGLVNPERIIANKNSGEIIEKDSPEGKVLTTKEIKDLIKIAKKVEKLYHSHQDIEWAIKKGKIYVLQSRPITN